MYSWQEVISFVYSNLILQLQHGVFCIIVPSLFHTEIFLLILFDLQHVL